MGILQFPSNINPDICGQWSFAVSFHGMEGSITEGCVLLKGYFMDWGLVF